jgi:predicted enzyme related to lactoylglutathione lyase
MSDFNSQNNRAVWFDIPIVDLDRSMKFYAEVLKIEVGKEKFEDFTFAVLEHKDGNGGCLVPRASEVSYDKGILIYLNVDGRIRDAVGKVTANGGEVIEDTHSIGPHGFRALIKDSEGNRLALHSNTDT